MEDESTVLIIENMNPVFDKQMRYYKNPEMKKMTKIPFDTEKYLRRQKLLNSD